MTKFSIILPVYNVEKYLSACVDSILNQTMKDYEVILVDDGSKDSSGFICDDYAKKYDCIKVIHKPNGGQADARNVGLKKAIGDYVFFIDSDDYLINDSVLFRISQRLNQSPDIVHFGSVEWYEMTGKTSSKNEDLCIEGGGHNPHEIYLELINKDSFRTSPWSKVVKRSLLVANGIEFEKGLLGEDNDWFYKVVNCVETIELINESFYVYRQRTGSTTKSYGNKNLEDLLWIIEKWLKFVNEGELSGMKMVIRNDLARQYCNAIIGYSGLKNKKNYFQRIKSLCSLLQYGNNPRVRSFRKIKKIFGLRGLVFMLSMYKRFKKI